MAVNDVADLVGFTPGRPAAVANLQHQSFASHNH
jgi:hypothetical protein